MTTDSALGSKKAVWHSFPFAVQFGDEEWSASFDIDNRDSALHSANDDALLLAQEPGEYRYLTHSPRAVTQRPDVSFPVPSRTVTIVVELASEGLDIALWLVEFSGDRQIRKHSWRIEDDRGPITWTPDPACDSVRLALRIAGSGSLGRPRFIVEEKQWKSRRGSARKGAFEDECMAVWSALNRPRGYIDPVASIASPLLETSKGVGPAPTVVDIASDRSSFEQALEVLAMLGLDPGSIRLDGHVPDKTVFPHLQSALTQKRYDWVCPFSQAPVSSRDTFLVSHPSGRPYSFVRFESGENVYYLILCPFRGSRIGAYFPREEVVVSRLKLGPLVRVFRALAVRHASSVRRYLLASEPRRLTVPLDTMSHWGHVLLNEFEALEWLFESGGAADVDIWLKGEVAFFETEQLYSEIPRDRIRFAVSPDARFRFCVEENAFVVRPQIAFMQLGAKLAARITGYCRSESERLGLKRYVEDRLTGHFPVIWCEIRANDRIWLNQMEGLVAVVNRLKPDYPQLAVVLAGWSRMLAPNEEDERMIEGEEEVIRRLSSALSGTPCMVVSGVSTREKMLWALESDLHVSIFGSGILFALLAEMPGVTLVSRYYQENELFLGDPSRQVHFMEGDEALNVLPSRHVSDDMQETNGEIRGFSVDAAALADFVHDQVAGALSRTR